MAVDVHETGADDEAGAVECLGSLSVGQLSYRCYLVTADGHICRVRRATAAIVHRAGLKDQVILHYGTYISLKQTV